MLVALEVLCLWYSRLFHHQISSKSAPVYPLYSPSTVPPVAHPVHLEFKPIATEFKSAMVQCNHCTVTLPKQHVQRKKDHLANCEAYQRLVKSRTALNPEPVASSASGLPFKAVPLTVKAQREKLLARALYAGGLAFSTVDPQKHPEWRDFVRSFDRSWQPPSRERLAGVLLDNEYKDVSDEVKKLLKREARIDLTADESTANNSDRVANIAVNTAASSAFHLHTMSLEDRNVTAEEVVELVKRHANEVTEGDLLRWNSICTDTCSTLRLMHRILEVNPATSHVFSVLCDSHGLQLFVKDVLNQSDTQGIPYYTSTLAEAVYISNVLRKSKLLLAIIRKIAVEGSLNFRAFATAAITR
jgi:hypothetical protein